VLLCLCFVPCPSLSPPLFLLLPFVFLSPSPPPPEPSPHPDLVVTGPLQPWETRRAPGCAQVAHMVPEVAPHPPAMEPAPLGMRAPRAPPTPPRMCARQASFPSLALQPAAIAMQGSSGRPLVSLCPRVVAAAPRATLALPVRPPPRRRRVLQGSTAWLRHQRAQTAARGCTGLPPTCHLPRALAHVPLVPTAPAAPRLPTSWPVLWASTAWVVLPTAPTVLQVCACVRARDVFVRVARVCTCEHVPLCLCVHLGWTRLHSVPVVAW
jgi:hypothetical protein